MFKVNSSVTGVNHENTSTVLVAECTSAGGVEQYSCVSSVYD